jgi:DNA repair exonuclease SbcCD ATPase subunit
MKIKLLKVENLKKVKYLEFEPEENVIVISGKNGAGKTSVLDAIMYGLGGVESKDLSKPIREGEDHAEIVLKIDNFTVKRIWTSDDKSYLKITSEDGVVYKSPQNMLDSFLGKLSFDPLEFTMFKPREQRDLLLEVLGLKEKLLELDEEREEVYQARTIIGRELKTYEGQLEGIQRPENNLPGKEISLSDLSKKLEESKDHNSKLDATKSNLNNVLDDISNTKEEIERLKAKLESLESKKTELEGSLKDKEYIDIEPIRGEIKKAEITNIKIREAEKFMQLEKSLRDKKNEYSNKTKEIEKIDQQKLKILQESKMPVDKLSIDEEGVIFNNIPFNQLSSSEKLKVSLAVAMALNPELKVIRITDGSLLDEDNMRVVEEMAEKFDYQIWLERVSIDDFTDITMVDGQSEINN